jgi:hypothetical protein
MKDMKALIHKALQGDMRAYRKLVCRYGKVTTQQLIREESKQCR